MFQCFIQPALQSDFCLLLRQKSLSSTQQLPLFLNLDGQYLWNPLLWLLEVQWGEWAFQWAKSKWTSNWSDGECCLGWHHRASRQAGTRRVSGGQAGWQRALKESRADSDNGRKANGNWVSQLEHKKLRYRETSYWYKKIANVKWKWRFDLGAIAGCWYNDLAKTVLIKATQRSCCDNVEQVCKLQVFQ